MSGCCAWCLFLQHSLHLQALEWNVPSPLSLIDGNGPCWTDCKLVLVASKHLWRSRMGLRLKETADHINTCIDHCRRPSHGTMRWGHGCTLLNWTSNTQTNRCRTAGLWVTARWVIDRKVIFLMDRMIGPVIEQNHRDRFVARLGETKGKFYSKYVGFRSQNVEAVWTPSAVRDMQSNTPLRRAILSKPRP